MPFFNYTEAISFNAAVKKNHWHDTLPYQVYESFPDLLIDPASPDINMRKSFAFATWSLQKSLTGIPPEGEDGKLGKGTAEAAHQAFNELDINAGYMVIGRNRVKANLSDRLILRPFDAPGGLDLHKEGDFRKSPGRKPRLLVLHWGGLTLLSCFNALASRGLSSHGGFSPKLFQQWLDFSHIAWHAGYVNGYSIGLDICQSPEIKYQKFYADRGEDLKIVINETGRGAKKVLQLNPDVAKDVLVLTTSLCKILDIPMQGPTGPNTMGSISDSVYHGVMDKSFLNSPHCRGIIGHHHVAASKWDIACWWKEIFV